MKPANDDMKAGTPESLDVLRRLEAHEGLYRSDDPRQLEILNGLAVDSHVEWSGPRITSTPESSGWKITEFGKTWLNELDKFDNQRR